MITQQLYHAKQLYDFEIRIHQGTVLGVLKLEFCISKLPTLVFFTTIFALLVFTMAKVAGCLPPHRAS